MLKEMSAIQIARQGFISSYKKSKFFFFQVKLERVLGLTVPSNAAIACAPSSGVVAYPAG